MGQGRRWKPLLFCVILTVLVKYTFCKENATLSKNNRRGKALNISKKSCTGPSGDKGICTFKWDCIRQNGTKIGTCMDGFIIGTCCNYPNDLNYDPFEPENKLNAINTNKFETAANKPHKNSLNKHTLNGKPIITLPTASAPTVKISESSTATSLPSTTPQLVTWTSISPTKVLAHKNPSRVPTYSLAQGVIFPQFQGSWPSGIAYPVNFYRPNRPLQHYQPTLYGVSYANTNYKTRPKNSTVYAGNFTVFSGAGNKVNKLPSNLTLATTTISVPIAQWMSTKNSGNTLVPVMSPINRLPVPTGSRPGLYTVSGIIRRNSTLKPLTSTKPAVESQLPVLQSTSTTTGKPPKRKPVLDYRKDCGVRALAPRARIVGGLSAHFGKWPWQILVKEAAWLGLYHKNKCGGVLISSKYAITAGHCQPGFLSSLIVLLGEYDLAADIEALKPEMRRVKRMVVHRHYNPQNFDNDIAILELDPPVIFKPHISPICLPHRDEDFTGKMAYVTGWGKTVHGGAIPNLLQEVQVPVVSNAKCLDMFKAAGHIKVIKDNFLCAGYETGGKDSCEGDSGGPLMVQRNNSQWVLAGTVSHGIRCADPNLPGVYMRISSYRPWIDKIIGSN